MGAIFIKTASGLTPVGGSNETPSIDKAKILELLGYTPADERKLLTSIDETDKTDEFIIQDPKGNVIAKINADGLGLNALFSHKDKFIIQDPKGNVGFKLDQSGLEVPALSIKGEEIIANNPFKDKKVSIIGDSMSTFKGYLPSGYITYYPAADVTSVEQTWWKQVIDKNKMKLAVNASYSGSTVSTLGAGIPGSDTSRTSILGEPDIIFILMGYNDLQLEDLSIKKELNVEMSVPLIGSDVHRLETNTFVSAYQSMIEQLIISYPHAQIICLGLPYTSFAANIKEITNVDDTIQAICNLYGVNFIDLRKSGITIAYYTFLENEAHLTAAGHKKIADYVNKALLTL